MLSCKTTNCVVKGVENTAPVEGILVCGLCGQEMTASE
jgi:hypothetical protein